MSRPPSGARASRASGLAPNSPSYPPPHHSAANMSSSFVGSPPYLYPPGPGGGGGGGPGRPNNMSMSVVSRPHSRPPSRHEPPPLSNTAGPMPGTLERPVNGPKKRLIMTCDGTWLNADSAIKDGQKTPPSNVSRLGWAIKETSRDGIPQVVNYQAGVGTDGGMISRIVGGATGHGLKENVREAYTFLATNWRPGDEIFLIGFSRGAYTARSVGGFIGELGLLTRTGLPFFNEIWEDFEHKLDQNYRSPFPDAPFPQKPNFGRSYIRELERLGMTRTNVNIKAICCFDTVGNLGIPVTPLTGMLRGGKQTQEYQFFDTSLSPCVENAFQALALDETRAPFSPALWEKKSDNKRTNLMQVWFPGVHSNIGGGYDDQEIANITLAWMMSRLEPFLDFRGEFLISQYEDTKRYYKQTRQKPRPWSFGEIYRSLRGVYAFSGAKVRTPGNYFRVDPDTMRPTREPLRDTNEYIHASVRTRLGLQGPGVADRGVYAPRALQDWTYEASRVPGSGANPSARGNLQDGGMFVWKYHGAADLVQTTIPEINLLNTEILLLHHSAKAEEYVRTGSKPKSSRRRAMANGGARPSTANGGPPPYGAGAGAGGSPRSRRRQSERYTSTSRGPPGAYDRNGGPDDSEAERENERDRRRPRRRSGDPRREPNDSRRTDRNRDRDRASSQRRTNRRRPSDDDLDDDDDRY